MLTSAVWALLVYDYFYLAMTVLLEMIFCRSASMTVVLQCCDGCAALSRFRVNRSFKAVHATSNVSQHNVGC